MKRSNLSAEQMAHHQKALIQQFFSGFARLREVETELRDHELQPQPVSWEFFVELSEDPPLLDLLPAAWEGESNLQRKTTIMEFQSVLFTEEN